MTDRADTMKEEMDSARELACDLSRRYPAPVSVYLAFPDDGGWTSVWVRCFDTREHFSIDGVMAARFCTFRNGKLES